MIGFKRLSVYSLSGIQLKLISGSIVLSYPRPNLSVVVLAYRSENNICGFVDTLIALLEREEPEWELVLVANHFSGDGDQTPENS